MATPTVIVAAKPTCGVGFVAVAPRNPIAATKSTRASQYFVAILPPAEASATFVLHSQHFVALPTTAATIATKRWLSSALPSRS
jgi:hypothetical protein